MAGSTSRHPAPGLLAALLALVVQLGFGASVPRPDPATALAGVETLCHGAVPATPSPPPAHPPDCLACLLCTATHAPAAMLAAAGIQAPAPAIPPAGHAELPPPARAPPVRERSPSQPRAPPILRLHA